MRYSPASSPTQLPSKPTGTGRGRRLQRNNKPPALTLSRDRNHAQGTLPVAFCSSFALALLGFRPREAPAITGRDVFAVLAASQLGLPAVGRAPFRAGVLGKIACGESVAVDLMAPAGASFSATAVAEAVGIGGGAGRSRPPGRAKTVATAGGGSGSGSGSAAQGESSGEGRPRLNEMPDRKTEFFGQVLFPSSSSAASSPGKGPVRRVVSNWVPLKDAVGKVQWVVLVLTPVDGGPG